MLERKSSVHPIDFTPREGEFMQRENSLSFLLSLFRAIFMLNAGGEWKSCSIFPSIYSAQIPESRQRSDTWYDRARTGTRDLSWREAARDGQNESLSRFK
jgi:hypothetical protein